jgi:hypothetical protein
VDINRVVAELVAGKYAVTGEACFILTRIKKAVPLLSSKLSLVRTVFFSYLTLWILSAVVNIREGVDFYFY